MSQAIEIRPCRKCGMTIEIHEGPNGKAIPLQKVRSVYGLTKPLFGGSIMRLDQNSELEDVFVSHFETCPHASSFSRGRKA